MCIRDRAHAVQIVAAAVAAALICLLVCMFALTPKYQASINMIVNTRQDTTTTFTSDNFNSAKNLISTYAVDVYKRQEQLIDLIIRQGDLCAVRRGIRQGFRNTGCHTVEVEPVSYTHLAMNRYVRPISCCRSSNILTTCA